MVMDLIVILILAATIFLTMRKGFVLSVANFFRGFVSIILAWILCDDAAALLSSKTELRTFIYGKISSTVSDRLSMSESSLIKPYVINSDSVSSIINNEISKLSDAIMTILGFFAVLLLVRIIISLLCNVFSRKKRSGFTGFTDGLLGLIFGIFLGIINIFVGFSLLYALISFASPQSVELIEDMFQNSYIALDLYNNNFLLKLLYDFMI